MNKGTIIKGLFVLAIGFAITMGCLESEPAMLEFVASFGFSRVEGIGLGAVVGFIGLILLGVGAKAQSP